MCHSIDVDASETLCHNSALRNQPHLVSFEALHPLGFQVLMPYKILMCSKCKVGFLPSGVTNDLKAIHGLMLRLAQCKAVEVLCMQECIARETSDVALAPLVHLTSLGYRLMLIIVVTAALMLRRN